MTISALPNVSSIFFLRTRRSLFLLDHNCQCTALLQPRICACQDFMYDFFSSTDWRIADDSCIGFFMKYFIDIRLMDVHLFDLLRFAFPSARLTARSLMSTILQQTVVSQMPKLAQSVHTRIPHLKIFSFIR